MNANIFQSDTTRTMNISPITLIRSWMGTCLTVVLGEITKGTSSEIAAFVTIVVGTLTGILTFLKIVDWFEKRKAKKKWESKHKTP